MTSATDYIRVAQENAFRDPRFGFDFADVADDSLEAQAIYEVIVRTAARPDTVSELPDGGLNLRRNLRQMANTLHDDLRIRIRPEHRTLWDQTVIGILPSGVVNGYVLRDDGLGNVLDRYVIALNYGLTLGCCSLADALSLEILEGDLLQYAEDGSQAFRYSLERFLSPTLEVYERTTLDHRWPSEVKGRFAVQSGALVSIMLQFVALHEFGHVVNGDVVSKNGVRTFHAVSNTVEFRREEAHASQNWPCEFAADAYAIETLCDWQGGRATSWPNFAQAYLFFGWLEQVERERGRPLCLYHPPPIERKQAILSRALALSPAGPPADYTAFIDGRLAAWTAPDSLGPENLVNELEYIDGNQDTGRENTHAGSGNA